MTAFDLLCHLCSLGQGVRFRGALYHRDLLGALKGMGFFRDVGVVSAIACTLCGELERAEVEVLEDGARFRCRDLAWRPIPVAKAFALTCSQRKLRPMDPTAFSRELAKFCREQRLEVATDGAQPEIVGVRISASEIVKPEAEKP